MQTETWNIRLSRLPWSFWDRSFSRRSNQVISHFLVPRPMMWMQLSKKMHHSRSMKMTPCSWVKPGTIVMCVMMKMTRTPLCVFNSKKALLMLSRATLNWPAVSTRTLMPESVWLIATRIEVFGTAPKVVKGFKKEKAKASSRTTIASESLLLRGFSTLSAESAAKKAIGKQNAHSTEWVTTQLPLEVLVAGTPLLGQSRWFMPRRRLMTWFWCLVLKKFLSWKSTCHVQLMIVL